ncbi:MAG: hypothetical protein EBQ92_01950, partial [Proteobacteria bacterium]|nr:hypothetical protein [Pseudomonadota bacterium]
MKVKQTFPFTGIAFCLMVTSVTTSALIEVEKTPRARPPWVDYFPAEDSENLYYIGRASEVKN